MGRSMIFVAAFAAVSAAAAAGDAEQGLRGGRSLQTALLCNSIGCPAGFIPIDNAQETVCDSDPCDAAQCCLANCSFHACTNSLIPIDDAQDTICPAFPTGCDDELCCQDVSNQNNDNEDPVFPPGTLFCNSIGCPNGFIPIAEAQTTVCDSDPCDAGQCCEAVCAFHACSNGLIPIDDAQTTPCPAFPTGCDDELCCQDVSNQNTDPTTPTIPAGSLLCNSIGCPNGFAPIDNAQTTVCDSDPCSTDQCCNLFCNSIGCPSTFIPIVEAQTTLCDSDPCDEAQCCESFCAFHACPNGLIPIDEAQTTPCPAFPDGCNDALCCV